MGLFHTQLVIPAIIEHGSNYELTPTVFVFALCTVKNFN